MDELLGEDDAHSLDHLSVVFDPGPRHLPIVDQCFAFSRPGPHDQEEMADVSLVFNGRRIEMTLYDRRKQFREEISNVGPFALTDGIPLVHFSDVFEIELEPLA